MKNEIHGDIEEMIISFSFVRRKTNRLKNLCFLTNFSTFNTIYSLKGKFEPQIEIFKFNKRFI